MDEMKRFRAAVVAWAAGGPEAGAAAATAGELAAAVGLRAVVLVEGASDVAAIEALALRRSRDLDAEGVAVVPLGGATSIGRFLGLVGPQGLDVPVAGLCDAGEEGYFRRSLERAGLGADLSRDGMESLGFYVCVADLEQELIRALGVAGVEQVVEAQGDLRSFRTFQKQPAQRGRTVEQQLKRFMGTLSGRKIHYAQALVDGLDLARVPRPLDRLLAHVHPARL
ncbi:TOPRIM nucleotidyl transferase/hydrolase domain-containing protein [Streptacidiphilus cavernicola]|uniref:TOPRIM nucleotidyl transferase/hydrolase domain-containing protein n=1 Tax=Streptacidiphilus cavernicola TaxID=3342716 RepID=A0ABV6W5D1_9ACTN